MNRRTSHILVPAFAVLSVLLIFNSPATAELKIKGPTAVESYKIVELTAESSDPSAAIIWDVDKEDILDMRELPGGKLLFTGPPGTYKFKVRSIAVSKEKTSIETARWTVAIGTPDPPKPAVSIVLTPLQPSTTPGGIVRFTATVTGSNDPSVVWVCTCVGGGNIQQDGTFTAGNVETIATVTAFAKADQRATASTTVTIKGTPPQPAPIEGKGFKVLIVYETMDLPKMLPAQQNILFTKQIRDYLNTTCVMGPDTLNKTREWRIYDQNIDTSGDTATWQNAMKRKRDSVPWIIISNGDKGTGYEGPLPADVNATLELLKKYAQ